LAGTGAGGRIFLARFRRANYDPAQKATDDAMAYGDEPLLDLKETGGIEHLDSQVQRAQEQQLQLQRELEKIERQKRELEELSRRQDEFQQGRAEMVEQLTRAIVVVERESFDAQKRVEQLRGLHASFAKHLDAIESIDPKSWDPEPPAVAKELSRSLSAVEDARAEYHRARAILAAHSAAEGAELPPDAAEGGGYEEMFGAAPGGGFVHWLGVGFAFTLPLIIGLLVAAILFSVLPSFLR
jgi:hypothetical protein